MADMENGQVGASYEATAQPDRQTALLQELVGEVRALRAVLGLGLEEFARYKPILDAYLRPNGPVGWAVARQQKKAERRDHG